MLRNPLPDSVIPAFSPPAGLIVGSGRAPLRGLGVFSRRGDLVGYRFNAADFLAKAGSCGSQENFRKESFGVDRYIAFLNRIVWGCTGATLTGPACGGPCDLVPESWLLIGVKPQALLVERFAKALIRLAPGVESRGFSLCLVLEAGELLDIHDLRELRKVIFQLSDNDIDVVLSNPVLDEGVSPVLSVIERVVSMIAITPEWLAIGSGEQQFDHSAYVSQVTKLNTAIHEGGKSVVCQGIGNDWQASFVSSLPVAYFSYEHSGDDVYL